MSEIQLIEIKEDILSDNRQLAEDLKRKLRDNRVFLLNLMSSPGSGKTSLIVRTIENLKQRLKIGVLEADIDSTVDAEKVASRGVHAVQLRTGGFCHLDASMVDKGLAAFDLANLDLIIIENVGNLVCPAEFDTGAIRNAMILSVPEGDDKPLKYPLMFTVSDVLIVNKMDYLPFSDFSMTSLRERVLRLNKSMEIIEVSCRTGDGIETWCSWLEGQVQEFLQA
ncbi:MAG: hydrogenase nickel incorporation protein HypB [Desulfomonilia bacterium]|nr:hydrogenase nickel incorporation protein HypB [Desulfomonilia bacterium]